MKVAANTMTLSLLLTVLTGSFVAAPTGASDDDSFEVMECEQIENPPDSVSLVCKTLVGVMAEDGQNWHQFRQANVHTCDGIPALWVCFDVEAKMGFGEGCENLGSNQICLQVTGSAAGSSSLQGGSLRATLSHLDPMECDWNSGESGCGGSFKDRGNPVHIHEHDMIDDWQCHDSYGSHYAQGDVFGRAEGNYETCYRYGPLADID